MDELEKNKLSIFIYREWKTGEFAMARPCPACMRMIQDLGITRIVYSTNNRNGYCEERVG